MLRRPESRIARGTPEPGALTRQREEGVFSVVILAATLAFVEFVRIPSTLQPEVSLSDAAYVATPCAPVDGGHANRHDWTFTLTSGRPGRCVKL